MKTESADVTLATVVQAFFLERLIAQRNASRQTVAAYRDSFRLLLQFAERHLGQTPERLALTDVGCPFGPRLPRPPGAQPPQYDPQSERALGGDSIIRALRRLQRPRRPSLAPAGARDPHEALRQTPPRIPLQRRDSSDLGRTGGSSLERAARSDHVRDALQHRRPGLRTDGPPRGRPRLGRKRLCASSWERPQRSKRTVMADHDDPATTLAAPH